MKDKISLEEIYKSVIITTNHGDFNTISKDTIFEFAKEACRQTLKLAAENVCLIEEWEESGKKYREDIITIWNEYNELDKTILPDKQSILDTIKLLE